MLIPKSVPFILLTCYLLLFSLESQGSSHNYVSCSGGGFCVPYYLCANGTIITNGDGLIDLRFGENHCPTDLVCCRDADVPIAACDKTCVKLYQCLDDVFDGGNNEKYAIPSDMSYCPDNKICCNKVRGIEFFSGSSTTQKCLGKCIPFDQCYNRSSNSAEKDVIDLRLIDENCNGDNLVCCLEPETAMPLLETAKICNGSCVPSHQCMNATLNSAEYGIIDLRLQYDSCPEDLVCCYDELTSKPDCHGICMPASECSRINYEIFGKDAIDLRSIGNGCDRQGFVCCMDPIPPQTTCNGTCVPISRCPNDVGNGKYDLRIGYDLCSDNMICCTSIPKLDQPFCTCVHPRQCLDDNAENGHAKDSLDLRAHEKQCPSQQVCCKYVKPNPQETSHLQHTDCKGACVPFNQCKNGTFNSDGEGIINFRSHNGCAGDLVCCDVLSTSLEIVEQQVCEGKCVPRNQCPDGSDNPFGLGLINLRRRSTNACKGDLICCVDRLPAPSILDNGMQSSTNCNGKCVPYVECDTVDKNSIDLRIYGDCPRNLVCCGLTVDTSLNPMLISSKEPSKNVCGGTCVPLVQCADSPAEMMNHIIDLRFGSNQKGCSSGTVCCNNPIRQTSEEQQWMHWIQDMNNMVDTGAQNTEKCFLDIDRHTDQIRQEKIPWLTTIWRRQQYLQDGHNQYLCAGALVRADVVLATADCIHDQSNDSLFVKLGNAVGHQGYQITVKVVHPDFNPALGTHNIALLFLKNQIEMKHLACISNINENLNSQACLIVGWSKHNFEDMSNPSVLAVMPQKQYISILQSPNCPLHTFCTGRSQSDMNCNRMRGATVICPDQTDQNWKIVGIVAKNNGRCDLNGIPETLVAIPQMAPWIREQLSPSFVQKPVDLGASRQYLPAI